MTSPYYAASQPGYYEAVYTPSYIESGYDSSSDTSIVSILPGKKIQPSKSKSKRG